jgi:hypothetical protein
MRPLTRQAFDAADDRDRAELAAELARTLTERVQHSSDLRSFVRASVDDVRGLGHELWRHDEGDDYQIWGPKFGTDPGVLITFSRDGARASWRAIERPHRSQKRRPDPVLRMGDPFDPVVRKALGATPVPARIEVGPAAVLERIARGGGATCWYYCRDATDLEEIMGELAPGSIVSFYFDGRLRHGTEIGEAVAALRAKLRTGAEEVVLGVLRDRIHVHNLISTSRELDEIVGEIADSAELLYGAYPAADNDGIAAVTFTVPDADGVVRRHPH